MSKLVEREPDREPGLTAPPYVLTDTIQALYDLGEDRISAMDAARIDKQVLSLWSTGVQVFDPEGGFLMPLEGQATVSPVSYTHLTLPPILLV